MSCIAGLALAMLFISGARAQETLTVQSNHRPINIPDNDARFAIESTIAVDADLVIADVNVTLNVEHPSIGDLEIDLYAPNGQRIRLADEVCSDADNFASTVFDDEAPTGIGETCPPGSGTFRPDGDLDEFDGTFGSGFWTLSIRDTEDGNVGALIGWSLTITGDFATEPIFSTSSIVNAASFLGGAVVPGEISTIFGTALGPPAGEAATVDSGTQQLPTELAGVQVFFDEFPAPLFYVSSSQLNVQVPFEITGRPDTTIRVQFNDTESASVAIPVLGRGPGIFTLNGRGQGHAIALNANGSVNDINNAAAPGSTITLFATGLGQVDPQVPSGQLASSTTLSQVADTVTATVGQSQAEVQFAGLAPNFVGLYQINVVIPADVESNAIVPVTLTVGDGEVENLTWITVD